MNSGMRHIVTIFSIAVFLGATPFVFNGGGKHYRDIKKNGEDALKVNIDAGFGNVLVERGTSGLVLRAEIDADLQCDPSEYIEYYIRDNVGYLNINTSDAVIKESGEQKKSFHISGLEDNDWVLGFTDAVPISFDIELGMGKGNFDFTGLSVKDLNLSTGASSVIVKFDEANKAEIKNLTIETGLSKFKGYGLCNANFEHLKFEGGVGSYLLDFSGRLEKEVEVDIEMGLGTLSISIPGYIGTKVYYEKSWVASIELPDDISEEEENNYLSSNYYRADGKINLHIEAGLGSVKIKRK